jgi:hypothetical protein
MIDKNLITEFFKNEQVIFGSENELVLNFAFYVRTRFSEAKLQFECPFNLKYMKQSNAEGNYEPEFGIRKCEYMCV